jgi:2-C-methyl-D-erythritol 4-phosphate cytidylyltransferase
MSVNKIVMIVAGGTGTRMNAPIPKQFLPILGVPLLMHTLEVFYRYDQEIRIIVVLPETQIQTWKALCNTYNFMIRHELRPGGITRFHSVKNNLDLIEDDSLVGIHDGVRPLVHSETIKRCYAAALKYGNAVPAVSIPETLRKITTFGSEAVDRNLFRLVQTPQVFVGKLLKKAYLQEYNEKFTDDAGVVDQLHEEPIHIVEGNTENIKITYSGDIQIAEALLKTRQKNQ